jgi:hypothetical protein
MTVKDGERYKHFKGDIYRVVSEAKHSETSETLVIYHEVHQPYNLWVRPLEMFEGFNSDGIKRFELIEPPQDSRKPL